MSQIAWKVLSNIAYTQFIFNFSKILTSSLLRTLALSCIRHQHQYDLTLTSFRLSTFTLLYPSFVKSPAHSMLHEHQPIRWLCDKYYTRFSTFLILTSFRLLILSVLGGIFHFYSAYYFSIFYIFRNSYVGSEVVQTQVINLLTSIGTS